jgi:hypothetical protein
LLKGEGESRKNEERKRCAPPWSYVTFLTKMKGKAK